MAQSERPAPITESSLAVWYVGLIYSPNTGNYFELEKKKNYNTTETNKQKKCSEGIEMSIIERYMDIGKLGSLYNYLRTTTANLRLFKF